MRFVGITACVCVVGWVFATGCATGTEAGGDDDKIPTTDSGETPDTSTGNKDSSTPKDSSTGNDSTVSGKDTGTTNCGGQCLGVLNTCCNNTCVDITSDTNNCNGCGLACSGSNTCCSSSCTDTMGTDVNNCGGCGVTCAGTCTNGQCQTQQGCTVDVSSCTHSPCVTGVALVDGCDDNDEAIVSFVCEIFDPSCCSSSWSATCVLYADELEENACGGC